MEPEDELKNILDTCTKPGKELVRVDLDGKTTTHRSSGKRWTVAEIQKQP